MTRRVMLFAALALSSCRKAPEEPLKKYTISGEILKLDEKGRVAVIRHQDILDASGQLWMKGMTMEFPVKDPADFARLKVGGQINATLYQRPSDFEYWLAEVQPAKP